MQYSGDPAKKSKNYIFICIIAYCFPAHSSLAILSFALTSRLFSLPVTKYKDAAAENIEFHFFLYNKRAIKHIQFHTGNIGFKKNGLVFKIQYHSKPPAFIIRLTNILILKIRAVLNTYPRRYLFVSRTLYARIVVTRKGGNR